MKLGKESHWQEGRAEESHAKCSHGECAVCEWHKRVAAPASVQRGFGRLVQPGHVVLLEARRARQQRAWRLGRAHGEEGREQCQAGPHHYDAN